MKKLFSFILCLTLGLTLISCSSNEKPDNDTKTLTENSNNQKKEQDSQNSTDTTSKDTKNSNTSTPKLVTLSIYTVDINNLKAQIDSTIQIDDSLSLKEKLSKLAKELSIKEFKGLPIEVLKVENINGINKATINLKDLANNTSIKWGNTYFEGTTGGAVTTKILTETFKQSSYAGEWINSVDFLYNNKKIQFQHVPTLENTIKLR
ncbi:MULTISPECIES: hypothetical protein [Clostridium]|uniref:Lipoprotein n=1 Tax=Clostridium cibarium TaxID=2762247 RepID=A0ABR8PQU8_9CLOT|nr:MULTISPECIES: hypothetical protein [Clostridium]MBD7910532.1 hypothetical protein [Clostridium cibarium]